MYKMTRQSIVRMIVDAISDQGDDVEYYEWDAHAEQFNLPDKDLFGVVAFSITQNGAFHDVTFGVGIMSRLDTNFAKMTDYMDLFYQRLQAQARLPLFHPDGRETGYEMVIFDGTSATPMTRVDQRPAQTVNCAGRLGVAGFTLPE